MSTSFLKRSKTEVWLIRETIDKINTNELPLNGDILRRIFFLIKCKKNLKDACKIKSTQIYKIWDKFKIPIREKQQRYRKNMRNTEHFKRQNQDILSVDLKVTYCMDLHCVYAND